MDDHPAADTDDADDVVEPSAAAETAASEVTTGTDQDDDPADQHDVDPFEGIEFDDDEEADDAPRHNALPRRVESWRTRTATGAVMSAMAMGLHQVFAKEQEKPAIVQEAPSDPYDDDDPVIVDYVADDAEGTTVTLRPWLLKKDEEA